MLKIRDLTADEVEFTFRIDEEYLDYRGNVMASGEEDVDRQAENWVRDQLAAGNKAAWCVATVTAVWSEWEFTGSTCLGGCSYESEEALWADLRETMKAEALTDLNDTIRFKVRALAPLYSDAEKLARQIIDDDHEHDPNRVLDAEPGYLLAELLIGDPYSKDEP